MSKKHVPDMDYIINLKAKKAEKHEPNTKRTQKEHKANTDGERFEAYKSTDLTTFSIRLLPQDIKVLKGYFSRRGTSLSHGIRQILLDFIVREGLK